MAFDLELRAAADEYWAAQHAHPFVRGLGDGTLPQDRFQGYIAQDYVFLVDYGRLLALGTARSPDLPTMRRFADLTQAILVTEMDLHRSMAASWGVDESTLVGDEAERRDRRRTSTGYCGPRRSATSPSSSRRCCRACGATPRSALRLADDAAAGRHDPGPYAPWVQTYASAEFQALADWCRELVNELARDVGAAARSRMTAAFVAASRHEVAFWQACWETPGQ